MVRSNMLAAALLAGTLLAGPAFAQDNSTSGAKVPDAATGTSGDTAVQAATPDAGTTASTGAPMDGKTAQAAIEGAAQTAQHIGTISAVSDIHVVRLSDIAGADQTALGDAVTKHGADITGLRSTLQANDALSAKLKEKSVDPTRVVAATIEADGAVTIFVK